MRTNATSAIYNKITQLNKNTPPNQWGVSFCV
nr:MAG TPA: hypothetical protein [Caudoviricetes sp.]